MFWTRTMPGTMNTTLSRQVDFLNRFFNEPSPMIEERSGPACNLWGDENGVLLTSEMPGFALEDIEITVSGRDISIKGRRSEERGEGVKTVRRERNRGEFERSFQLPYQIDAGMVVAKLTNGVLEVTLPRAEQDKPRKITIAVN